jgi:hypothetical protein
MIATYPGDYLSLGSTKRRPLNRFNPFEFRLDETKAAQSIQPDYQSTFNWYSDKWVQKNFTVLLRRDPALSLLRVRGRMQFYAGKPEVKVLYAGSVLSILSAADSDIHPYDISLKPVLAACKSEYCPIEFKANTSFNPKKAGQSTDDRDLSWQLYELKLFGGS